MNTIKTASEQATRKSRLLINRNFALLWSGQAISQLGDVVFSSTLMFWIVTAITRGQSWAPLAVSGLFLAEAIATFGSGPLVGVFVDRWEKRRTMLWMDALRAVLIILLLLPTDILPLPFQFVTTGQLVTIYLASSSPLPVPGFLILRVSPSWVTSFLNLIVPALLASYSLPAIWRRL